MAHAFESVTLAVHDLGSAMQLFCDQLGLTVVHDARASVGLLSAWHRPVHESVRLIELAKDSQSIGRVRLAHYEDVPSPQPAHDPGRDRASGRGVTAAGPTMLDFRDSGQALRSVAASGAVQWLEGHTPVALPGEAQARAGTSLLSIGALGTVWILVSDWERAASFYREILGFVCREHAELTVDVTSPWSEAIGAHGRSSVRVAAFFAPATPLGGAVLVDAGGAGAGGVSRTRDPGMPGINFLTCRCDDLDGVLDRLPGLEIEPVTRPSHVGLPNGRPARVMLVRGPSEELYELVEPAD
jgi:catechol 2,3-dioxygenase-like lactoylglutathione lyase family enzyme